MQEDEEIPHTGEQSFPAEPQKMPELTYWPFGAGVGMFFFLVGMISSWIVSLTGFILLVISFAGWIGDVNHDYDEGSENG